MRNNRRRVRRRRLVRRLVTCFLLFHLFTIIVAPASVDPTSPMWLAAWNVVRPYAQIVYLDQGWNFFSPEPGPSTLISYRATLPDGKVVSGQMPNKQMWPRLLYHRHFMLTSYLGFFDEALQARLCEGYAAHLRHEYQADEVEFKMLIHLLPTREYIGEGGGLDHEQLWEEYSLEELTEFADTESDERNEGVSIEAGETESDRHDTVSPQDFTVPRTRHVLPSETVSSPHS